MSDFGATTASSVLRLSWGQLHHKAPDRFSESRNKMNLDLIK